MFEAQIIIGNTTPGTQIYSPWFPKRGDNVTFTLDVIGMTLVSGNFSVDVYTKNSEDTGDGTRVGSTISATGTGPFPATYTGLVKELVRNRFTAVDLGQTKWALFRMLPPVWFDAGKA